MTTGANAAGDTDAAQFETEESGAETVVVLGGGIGGLSAAHELAERGFDVEVYEKRATFGGKARSVPVPGTAEEGTKPLPGEHGFRFFPAFYRHVFDTMRRIPYGDNEAGVYDNLEATTEWMIAREGTSEVTLPLQLPSSIEEWRTVIDVLLGNELDIPDEEKRFFADRILTFLTSCEERRLEEYEELPWWEFIDAESKSEQYRKFFGVGVTRGLVAMQAERSSTRTIGRIYVQLLFGIAMPWLDVDSVLNGPTNDVWLDPWVEHLRSLGVDFYPETTVERVRVEGGRVSGVEVVGDGEGAAVADADLVPGEGAAGEDGGAAGEDGATDGEHGGTADRDGAAARNGAAARDGAADAADAGADTEPSDEARVVTGDHYVCALPVEVVSELLTEELTRAAPSLADIDQLETAWMNGIQFYFDEEVPITHGHVIYEGAPWALTSISQQAFWEEVDLSEYGGGDVESVVSLCVSNWTDPGVTVDRPARECSPVEIKDEVWAQLDAWLNDAGEQRLDEDALVTWFLDPAVEFPAPNEATNAEPLLINTVGSLQYRPEADTAVPNLFLAADYVRTETDLATMEAANEAARRAANGILEATGSDAERCDLWELEEPAVFEPLKQYDKLRFEMGLPHRDAL